MQVVVDSQTTDQGTLNESFDFRPIGIMRQYERGPDGTFHDSLYMDLLADELDRRTVRSEDPA